MSASLCCSRPTHVAPDAASWRPEGARTGRPSGGACGVLLVCFWWRATSRRPKANSLASQLVFGRKVSPKGAPCRAREANFRLALIIFAALISLAPPRGLLPCGRARAAACPLAEYSMQPPHNGPLGGPPILLGQIFDALLIAHCHPLATLS